MISCQKAQERRNLPRCTSVQLRVFGTLAPGKIIELFHLGEATPPQLGVTTGDVVTASIHSWVLRV